MKLIITATLVTVATFAMLMATSALAISDPTPNTIGIYLDTEANEMCVDGLTEAMTEFTMHMILTNPTFDTMHGFLAGYHFEGVAQLNSAVLAQANATDSGGLGDHIVNFDSPVPTSTIMPLMTITATYVDFEYGPAVLQLHGIILAALTGNVPAAILDGNELFDLHLSFDDGSTVRINAGCNPVANESLSFDGIKSLYR